MDIDPAKVLVELEAEKERRLQAKIDAGEVVSVSIFVCVGIDDEADEAVEEAKAEKLAELRAAGEVREPVWDILVIQTGVPRPRHLGTPRASVSVHPRDGGPAASEAEGLLPPSPQCSSSPTNSSSEYIWISVRPATDDDPGEIVDGWFYIEDGTLVLEDRDHRVITTSPVAGIVNPAALARELLRRLRPVSEFNRAINYTPIGIA